jgi:hypothetical protein
MREYMEIGSTPYGEDCAQLGSDDYRNRAENEMDTYIRLLEREFPEALGNNINFKKKWFNHDFGTYGEVCMFWNPEDGKANAYVYYMESRLPEEWDKLAKEELGINND